MVAIAHRATVADPVGAALCCDTLSAADGSYMPAEPMTAGTAYQQPAERVFAGVPAAADGGVLFISAALHLRLSHVKHLLCDDRRVSVFCVVHRRLTDVFHPALG